eukprot:s5333_g9.t1
MVTPLEWICPIKIMRLCKSFMTNGAWSLVGHVTVPAVSPHAPDDDDEHVHHSVHHLSSKKLYRAWSSGSSVGLEAVEQLFGAPPKHDLIVGALADEGLVAVVLPAGRRSTERLVVVLAAFVSSPLERLSIA